MKNQKLNNFYKKKTLKETPTLTQIQTRILNMEFYIEQRIREITKNSSFEHQYLNNEQNNFSQKNEQFENNLEILNNFQLKNCKKEELNNEVKFQEEPSNKPFSMINNENLNKEPTVKLFTKDEIINKEIDKTETLAIPTKEKIGNFNGFKGKN